jgi:hypothetical protein
MFDEDVILLLLKLRKVCRSVITYTRSVTELHVCLYACFEGYMLMYVMVYGMIYG